jgi:hypothetical protein
MKQNFLTRLNDVMTSEYVSVDPEKNPVACALDSLGVDQLKYVIGQYAHFPKHIVSFLFSARDKARASGYIDVSNELTRNAGEELGTESQGVTHYEMLLTGLGNELGKKTEQMLRTMGASKSTTHFVNSISKELAKSDIAYVMGAMYVIESSAVPELRIIKHMADTLTSQMTGNQMILDPYLSKFFEMHLGTWEPGHEEGLRVIIPKYLMEESEKAAFEKGFRKVMSIMDEWWQGLYEEATQTV